MSAAELAEPLWALAAAADEIAHRVRPWRIGHELADQLTAGGRAMTPDEAAVVQALERILEWSDGDTSTFRAWWLDVDTELEETQDSFLAAWASVAKVATHPAVVAHLSDLLWTLGGNDRHRHARRAVDAYIAAASLHEESHDRTRALIRAHQLAGAVNDRERLAAASTTICDAADYAITRDDHDIAISLLQHLGSRRLPDATASRWAELLQRAWLTADRTDHVERLGRMLAQRADGEAERLEIVGRIVSGFLVHARQEDGFRRLIGLREALRVAEELGHPAHSEILHEIESSDFQDAFATVRSEQVMSRQDVAAFCAGIVGSDSLECALHRFAEQLPITPDVVEGMRRATPVSLRHLVTNVRLGEANSVVTSSDTTGDGMDTIEAAVDRDVRQRVGFHAQVLGLLLLVPALHQALAAYEPWHVADIRSITSAGLADETVADALARALEHFHHRRYDEALHVALPRVERLIRHIARECEIPTTKRPTKRVGGIRGLGEILTDLRGDGDAPILAEPVLTAAELTLTDPDSLNLRNEFLHGIRDDTRAIDAVLVLQIGLALSLNIGIVRVERSDS